MGWFHEGKRKVITHPVSSAQPSATSSSLGAKLVVSTFKLNIRGRSLAVSRADSDDAHMHAINQFFLSVQVVRLLTYDGEVQV
jgi:hypothetical protein